MIRTAALIALVAFATPAGAQINIFSPSPLTGEDWVGVTHRKGKTFQLAHEVALPAPTQAVASGGKGPRLSALAQETASPAGPTLKPQVTVAGEIVRIGDLVDNAGAVADVAIFRAPTPARPEPCRAHKSPKRCVSTK